MLDLNRTLIARLHRALVRSGPPLRVLWRAAYRGATRAYAAWLVAGIGGASVYLRASQARGEAVPALSDVDLAVLVECDGDTARVDRRYERGRKLIGGLLFDRPPVGLADELTAAAAGSSYSWGRDGRERRSLYLAAAGREGASWIANRPGLEPPGREWLHVAGPARALPTTPRPRWLAAAAAWLELQHWWRHAVPLCLGHRGPRSAYLCFKLYADSTRAWLLLAAGRPPGKRSEALRLALALLPEEQDALERALALERRLAHSPVPPLEDSVRFLARMTGRIAAELERLSEGAGRMKVALDWGGPDELVMPKGGWRSPLAELAAAGPLPLADWRALTWTALPDEALARVPGDPDDPVAIATAARAAGRRAVRPVLQGDLFFILPAEARPAMALRVAQCAVTDPVSSALCHGERVASFPELPGWRAADWAGRAVDEHTAWLHAPASEHAGVRLGRLISAARAGLFLDSVARGEPELPLTAAATLRAIARAEVAAPAEEAEEQYRAFAADWGEPPERLLGELRRAVLALPAYTRDARSEPLGRMPAQALEDR
jgi:hypothetical protein